MRLRWSGRAIADLRHALVYIQKENPFAVRSVIERVEKATSMLLTFPNSGREGRYIDTRELVIVGTPFIVSYRVQKEAIEILAVIHHARVWPEKL